jgi:mevalonate kinase
MILSDITSTTHGKWILSGEHAVIRGHSALVYPVRNKSLTITYSTTPSHLTANYSGDSADELHLLFWSVLEHGLHLLGKSINCLRGHFELQSDIPIGVGMGASAALCVATAHWFAAQQLIEQHSTQSFATELEHLFHGKSSGIDIAGVAATGGIVFKNGHHAPLHQTWHPTWYLSSCGQIGKTSHCINQVQNLWDKQPELAEAIDRQMQASVFLAQQALEQCTPNNHQQLAQAINLANDCFLQWGLVSESLHQHMNMLRNNGAIAVKPTGSGGGGYVVSLWEDGRVPHQLELIAV